MKMIARTIGSTMLLMAFRFRSNGTDRPRFDRQVDASGQEAGSQDCGSEVRRRHPVLYRRQALKGPAKLKSQGLSATVKAVNRYHWYRR